MTDSSHRERPGKLLDHLESFEQLHLVVRVAGDPQRSWTIAELVDGQPEDEVRTIAQELVEAGVFVRGPDDALSLAPERWVSEGAAWLVRSYKDDPLPIIQALTRRSMERLRSATARTFSEAFVVRRKDS